MLTSEAFKPKSIVCVLPEKKLTIPASVDRVTICSGLVLSPPSCLNEPKVTSPANLALLTSKSTNDRDSRRLYAPPIFVLDIAASLSILPIKMLL